jgi:CBS domain containing-hemolysin-like protein
MDDYFSLLQALPGPIISGNHYIIVGLCLVASAFFSGIEIAFLGANKLRIELQSKQGTLKARLLSRYQKSPSNFISTVLVANNLALVIYGIYMGEILLTFLQSSQGTILGFLGDSIFLTLLISTIISTLIVLVTAEFLPKSLFRINPDSMLSALIIPFRVIEVLLWPLVWFVKTCSHGILNLFIKEPLKENKQVFTTVDLDDYITSLEQSGSPTQVDIDTQILRNALDFSELKVRDFMVPRTNIIAIDIESSIEDLNEIYKDSAHSKILIYRDSIDNVLGFVHHNELFQKPSKISDIVKPIFNVTDTMQAHDLLREFTQKRKSIAIVIDEYGGTAGMATIEDVIEEIFGEIEDEFDTQLETETVVKPNHYIFSARLEVDHLNDKYHLNIPGGDYTTLGGYIMHTAERIPRQGEKLNIQNFEILITRAAGSRMEELELKVNDSMLA